MRHWLLAFGVVLVAAGCVTREPAAPPLQAVRDLDLQRYLGKWYEIASYPNRFQRGCEATTATYSKRPDGDIRVVNECRRQGEPSRIEGKAWLAGDGGEASKLEVRFFWPFSGNYWVIAVADDYSWAIVGEPSREYLWILARTPTLDDGLYARLLGQVKDSGYDPERLRRTPQTP
jgi:apolipoprotein D and lipocalin family protein